MPKVKPNAMFDGMSGALHNIVFRQLRDGTTVASRMPNFSHREFSTGQLSHQSRFRQAVDYAREASKSNPIYKELAKGTTKNAYNLALSDWFNPPVIRTIKLEGGTIRVNAVDDVQVAKVLVKISDAQGDEIEKGQAVLLNNGWWEYVPTAQGQVTVEAWDLAGNITTKEA